MLGKSINLEGIDSSKNSRMHQCVKMIERVVHDSLEFDEFIAFSRTTSNPLLQGLKFKTEDDLSIIAKHLMSWFKALRTQAVDEVLKSDASSNFEPVEVVFD